jgi:hypothetical protein
MAERALASRFDLLTSRLNPQLAGIPESWCCRRGRILAGAMPSPLSRGKRASEAASTLRGRPGAARGSRSAHRGSVAGDDLRRAMPAEQGRHETCLFSRCRAGRNV